MVLIIFLLGVSFGSFLNVLIDRLPKEKSVFSGRSKCESCHRILKPQDLVPIISYIILRGRCRYCHAKIPIRMLLVELSSGFLALGIFFYVINTNISPSFAFFLFVITLCLLGIFFSDLEYGIIPDEFVATIVGASAFLVILEKPNFLPEHFLVGILSFLLFFALYTFTRGRGMGFGDVKLASAIGFFLGFPNIIIGMYVAFLTAMIVSIILILMGRKKFKGGTIAFGPFLSIGALVGYFFGTRILMLIL